MSCAELNQALDLERRVTATELEAELIVYVCLISRRRVIMSASEATNVAVDAQNSEPNDDLRRCDYTCDVCVAGRSSSESAAHVSPESERVGRSELGSEPRVASWRLLARLMPDVVFAKSLISRSSSVEMFGDRSSS